MKHNYKSILVEYIGLITACIIMSVGLNMFLVPHTIAPGGLSGLSVVISKLTGFSVSNILFTISTPLLLFSVKILGKKDAIKTFIGMAILTIMLKITEPLSAVTPTDNTLLAAISGAILLGISLGILFRIDASTGGTDIIAKILNKYLKLDMGKSMQVVDMIVVVLGGITFGWEKGMYSLLIVFMNGFIIDKVIAGFNNCKEMHIMSCKNDEIKAFIMNDINRGCTIVPAKGAYSGQETEMIYCVVNRKQFIDIRKFIREIDPEAFITVIEAHEVLGKGFNSL